MGGTQTVRDIIHVVRDSELLFMAAAIAHYTLASLIPLLLLALALAAFVGSERVIESAVRNRLGGVLSENGLQMITEAPLRTEGVIGAGVLSVLFAVWSGSKVFRGLDVAFNKLYGVNASPSLLEQVRDAVIVIGLLASIVGTMFAISVLVSVAPLPIPNKTFVGAMVLLVALVLGLLPIYYVLTPVDTSVRDVLPGTLIAAGGLLALQVTFVYYTRYATRYDALGVIGGLLLFVTWLYFGSIVVLLGGAVNYVSLYTPV